MRTFRVGVVRAAKGAVRMEVHTTVRAARSHPRSGPPPRSRRGRRVPTALQTDRQPVAVPGIQVDIAVAGPCNLALERARHARRDRPARTCNKRLSVRDPGALSSTSGYRRLAIAPPSSEEYT